MALTPSNRVIDSADTQFTSFDIAALNGQYENLLSERSNVMDTVEDLIRCREQLTLQIEAILREQRLKGAL